MGQLRSLRILEITGCESSCKLPDSIGDLESLRELRLYSNGITELPESIGLPAEIGDLVRLEELDMRSNRELRGDIPREFDKLESLRSLDLSGTNICRISARIEKLPRLESLELEGCDEIQEVPRSPNEPD